MHHFCVVGHLSWTFMKLHRVSFDYFYFKLITYTCITTSVVMTNIKCYDKFLML